MFGNSDQIDRREDLSYREFEEEYLRPNKPVIIKDALKNWNALGKWTLDFFRTRYGPMDLEMDGLTMAEFIDLVQQSPTKKPKELPYLRNKSMSDYFPELEQDISPRPVYLEPNWFATKFIPKRIRNRRTDLFVGGVGSRFPYLHFDNYHGYAFVCQVCGEKEFIMYSPDQSNYLYPKKSAKNIANSSSIPDIENPDFEKFPLFKKAQPVQCVLRAGEMLFVARGWWHTTKILSPSITISTNTANEYNWSYLIKDHFQIVTKNPIKAIGGAIYLYLVWLLELFKDKLYRKRRIYSS
jgi:hypothetical protein